VTKAEFVRAIPKLGIEAETFEIEQLFGFFDPPRGQRWKASQQKDWHGSGSWRSAQVRRPHGAQLQEAVVAAAVADVVAAAAACIEGDAATAAITWATQSAV
jgi:hypothetical protein